MDPKRITVTDVQSAAGRGKEVRLKRSGVWGVVNGDIKQF